jgi:hypothetical protein
MPLDERERRSSPSSISCRGQLGRGGTRWTSTTCATRATSWRCRRPPDGLLPGQRARPARPHRPRAAALVPRTSRATTPCSACTRSASRRRATTRAPRTRAAARSTSSRSTAGRTTPSRTSWRCRGAPRTASAGWSRASRTGRATTTSSRCTTGGTARSATSTSGRSTRCWRSTTARSAAAAAGRARPRRRLGAALARVDVRARRGRPLAELADAWDAHADGGSIRSTTCTR